MIVVAFTFAEPRAPDRQGPQSATRTAPALPRMPRWTWDAVAFPVKLWKVSRQESFPPALLLTSPAVKVPCAPGRTPFGFGTSCAALSRAVNPVVVALSAPNSALLRPVQTPAARITGSATVFATNVRLFTLAPPCENDIGDYAHTPTAVWTAVRADYVTTKVVVRMRVFGRIAPTFSMFRDSW